MEMAFGLVDAVAGKQTYAECVRSTKSNTIDVLTAGSTLTNPYPLLVSDQFTALLTWARQRYEWIFIDSPPVLPVADSTVLGPRMDGTLLVVALGEYQREVVAHALMLLRQSGTRVTGTVLTKVRQYLPRYLQRYDTYPAYDAYPPRDITTTASRDAQP
jgi:tyrosine-protein kinase Etk/Wzc